MAPSLALGLALVCVLFVWAVDARKGGVSAATWLPAVWVMYSGSRALSYWLHPYQLSELDIKYEEGSPIDRIFLSVLMLLAVAVIARRRRSVRTLIAVNPWVIALFIYMGVSILWSDHMQVSFKRWVRIIGDLMMIAIVMSETDPVAAVASVLRRAGIVLALLSVVTIKYFRVIGIGYDHEGEESWVGITPDKNQLGQLCFVLGTFFLWVLLCAYRNRKLRKDAALRVSDALLVALSLWMIRGSREIRSVTAFAMLLAGALLLLLFSSSSFSPRRFRVLVVASVLVFVVANATFSVFAGKGIVTAAVESFGRDMTLTGRTDIWRDIREIAARDPLFGKGYGSFWIGNLTHNLWEKYPFPVKSAHNGYLDVYLEMGAIGLILLAVVILGAGRDILNRFSQDPEYGALRLTFLCTICLFNISETLFLVPTKLIPQCFLLVSLRVPERV